MSTIPVIITRKYGCFTVQFLGSTDKARKTVTSLEQNVNVFILEDTEETLGQKKSGCRKSRMRLPGQRGRVSQTPEGHGQAKEQRGGHITVIK